MHLHLQGRANPEHLLVRRIPSVSTGLLLLFAGACVAGTGNGPDASVDPDGFGSLPDTGRLEMDMEEEAPVVEPQDKLAWRGQATLSPGVAVRSQEQRIGGRDIGVSYVWINLNEEDVVVETSPAGFQGTAIEYVSEHTQVLAAINANFFAQDPTTCAPAAGRRLRGMAMSAGLRYPVGREYGVDRPLMALTCDYGNTCIFQPQSMVLDQATRRGTSRWKNIVTGDALLIDRGRDVCRGVACEERDAHSLIGLGGSGPKGWSIMVLAASDGSRSLGRGATLRQLARWLADNLGLQQVMRLDGGGSTQLAIAAVREDASGTPRRGGQQLNTPKYPVCARNVVDPLIRGPLDVVNYLTVRWR